MPYVCVAGLDFILHLFHSAFLHRTLQKVLTEPRYPGFNRVRVRVWVRVRVRVRGYRKVLKKHFIQLVRIITVPLCGDCASRIDVWENNTNYLPVNWHSSSNRDSYVTLNIEE